ncbi:ECF-type sigma factor, partial [Dokdonella sp.]|uniref:ECF-type sigma factor n=1 Tax=Dokdonella sp. TaxID=2291710 RepID=UPI002F42BDB7
MTATVVAGPPREVEFLHNRRMADSRTATHEQAVQSLVEVFYADLQRLARRERGRVAAPAETLGTTALVHEAYLKLARRQVFKDHAHFLNTAALAMRQALVSHARSRMR